MQDVAFSMRGDPANATKLTDDSRYELVNPKAVSNDDYIKYAVKKVVAYVDVDSDDSHPIMPSPLTEGICSVLGISVAGVQTWNLAFVRSFIRPFLEKDETICNDSLLRSKLLEVE